jgi:hypothetical protein
MKTLIILFIFISSLSYGQNILGPTYERGDNGVGLRYDRQFKKFDSHGVYFGAGYGKYQKPNMNAYKHFKLQLGYVHYLPNYAQPGWLLGLSAGLNAHSYKEVDKGYETVNSTTLAPFSCEIGVMSVMGERISVDWTWDFIKHDCVFGFRYRFGIY